MLAVAEDGDALVSSLDGGPALSIREADSGVLTPVISAPRGGAQPFGADLSDRYAVWQTTDSGGIDVVPWELHSYDRRTGEVKLLATCPPMDGGGPPPPPPGYTGAVLGGDRVLWAQVSGSAGAERVDIFGCRIDDCRPRRYLAGAAYPTATDRALYAIAGERYDGRRRTGRMRVLRVGLDSGTVTTVARVDLARDRAPTGLAAGERALAWAVSGPGPDTVTIRARGSEDVTVRSRPAGLFGFMVGSGRVLVWAESSGDSPDNVGGYVYDLAREQLSSIGDTSGLYNVLTAGSVLVWQEGGRGGRNTSVIARLH